MLWFQKNCQRKFQNKISEKMFWKKNLTTSLRGKYVLFCMILEIVYTDGIFEIDQGYLGYDYSLQTSNACN